MTELEAYTVNGWPLEGRGLILPATNSGADYTPYRCTYCPGRGVAMTSYFKTGDICPCCEKGTLEPVK